MTTISNNEALAQISRMTDFILSEAKDKAEEIEIASLEVYRQEKESSIYEDVGKLQKEFNIKKKKLEQEYTVANSHLVTSARATITGHLNTIMKKISEDVKTNSLKQLSVAKTKKQFLVDSVLQAALNLINPNLEVECLKEDTKLLEDSVNQIVTLYNDELKKSTGIEKAPLELIVTPTLSNDFLGGVIVYANNRTITIDCSVQARINRITDDMQTEIKGLLLA